MSTAVHEPPTALTPAIKTQATVEIPLDQISPSPYNRKTFNSKSLDDLAASIMQTQGVIEPVILRKKGQGYELVAGERRWRASKIAVEKMKFDRKTITAIIKELTDDQAIELLLIENGQREDAHPLELAKIYRTLLGKTDSSTGKPYSPELIAERVGKSVSFVYSTMQLDQLVPEIQQAFLDGKINASHAVEICRLQPKQQEQVFLGCFGGLESYDQEYNSIKEVVKDKEAEANVSVRALRQWIQENVLLDLSKAPFDPKDEFLLKGVGACGPCPKRAGSNPGLFGEIARGDTCTDPGCYDAKKNALVEIKIAKAQKEAAASEVEPDSSELTRLKNQLSDERFLQNAPPATVTKVKDKVAKLEAKKPDSAKAPPAIEIQKVSTEHLYHGDKRKPGVLYQNEYTLAKPGCKKEKKAIYADGPKTGQFAYICAVKDCSNHGYSSYSSGASHAPVTYERRLEIWRQKVQCIFRDELLKTILTKLPPAIGNSEAALVAAHILKTLPHRHAEKVARIYGLKEGASVDAYADKLKGADLQRFIVVCSLVEDLGVDGLAWGNLKGSLKIAAFQYKVDDEKLLDAAKTALEKKRPKSPAEKAAAESGKTVPTSGKTKPSKPKPKAKGKKTKK